MLGAEDGGVQGAKPEGFSWTSPVPVASDRPVVDRRDEDAPDLLTFQETKSALKKRAELFQELFKEPLATSIRLTVSLKRLPFGGSRGKGQEGVDPARFGLELPEKKPDTDGVPAGSDGDDQDQDSSNCGAPGDLLSHLSRIVAMPDRARLIVDGEPGSSTSKRCARDARSWVLDLSSNAPWISLSSSKTIRA